MKTFKKISALILSVISAACVAVGFSGCKNSGFLADKGYNYPNSIYILLSPLYSSGETIEDRATIKKIYNMFNSVDYKQYDELSEEDDYVLLGLSIWMRYDDDTVVDFSVAEDGKSICWMDEASYISEENAVDYVTLRNYLPQY